MSAILDAEPAPVSSWQTIRRGLSLSPELRVGLGGTLALSVVAMVGRVAVPIAVQQVHRPWPARARRPGRRRRR